jgi:hypothetical protein
MVVMALSGSLLNHLQMILSGGRGDRDILPRSPSGYKKQTMRNMLPMTASCIRQEKIKVVLSPGDPALVGIGTKDVPIRWVSGQWPGDTIQPAGIIAACTEPIVTTGRQPNQLSAASNSE